MIFLLVSIRQFFPFSILSIVNGETPAFLASSALLIRSSSRISFTIFCDNFSSRFPVYHTEVPGHNPISYIYVFICQEFSYKLIKIDIICAYIGYIKKKSHHILCTAFCCPKLRKIQARLCSNMPLLRLLIGYPGISITPWIDDNFNGGFSFSAPGYGGIAVKTDVGSSRK
jgi:hypothetical protein